MESNHLACEVPRGQRESPSEDELETQKRRKPLGFPGGFHGFLYGFAALAHTNLLAGERERAIGDTEMYAAYCARRPRGSFERPWHDGF